MQSTTLTHAKAVIAIEIIGDWSAYDEPVLEILMGLIRMPLALHPRFSTQLVELKDSLDKLRLPETSSAQFFEDLVQDEECICGRAMTDVARHEIRKRAKGYLDYDEAGTINALKHDISRFVAPAGGESRHEQLSLALAGLARARRQQREAQQTLSVLGHCAPIRIKGYSKEERIAQDLKRGRKSRVKKTPGSWEWLLKFRQYAPRRHAALAMFMFMTGARISQAVAMHPDRHLRLDQNLVCIPAAKGHDDRWITVPQELVRELASLPRLYPRGFERTQDNLRVFGFADRSSPRKGWAKACKLAGIDLLPFHAAGRHGFGQEMNVRQGIDEKAAGEFGGWSDTSLMRRTYTHAEQTAEKIHEAQLRGLRAAEERTKLTLFNAGASKKKERA